MAALANESFFPFDGAIGRLLGPGISAIMRRMANMGAGVQFVADWPGPTHRDFAAAHLPITSRYFMGVIAYMLNNCERVLAARIEALCASPVFEVRRSTFSTLQGLVAVIRRKFCSGRAASSNQPPHPYLKRDKAFLAGLRDALVLEAQRCGFAEVSPLMNQVVGLAANLAENGPELLAQNAQNPALGQCPLPADVGGVQFSNLLSAAFPLRVREKRKQPQEEELRCERADRAKRRQAATRPVIMAQGSSSDEAGEDAPSEDAPSKDAP